MCVTDCTRAYVRSYATQSVTGAARTKMGKTWDHISPYARQVIAKQRVFFIATAPLSSSGRVNVSPKGHGPETFNIIDDHRVAFLDLSGSGIETVAHVKENGRITFMFCNFDDGPPCIIRLWGRAVVHERASAEFDRWLAETFPAATTPTAHPGFSVGVRSIIIADIFEVASACGYAVPIMEYKQDRDSLLAWSVNCGSNGLVEYKQKKNIQSLDGLTGLELIADNADSSKGDSSSGSHENRTNGPASGTAAAAKLPHAWGLKPRGPRIDTIAWLAAGMAVGVVVGCWLSKQHCKLPLT